MFLAINHTFLPPWAESPICCNSWYGSMLWNLFGNAAVMDFRSWNTTVKIAWGVDTATHTYFVDHLLAQVMIPLRSAVNSSPFAKKSLIGTK